MPNTVLRLAAVLFSLSVTVPALSWPALKAHLHRTFGLSAEGKEVAFSPDSQLLATTSVAGVITLRHLPDGKVVRTLEHPAGVTTISFSRDGRSLASAGYDGTVRIRRLSDGALVRTLKGHQGTVWSVCFSPDGQRLASCGEDRTIKVWRVGDGVLLRTLRGHNLNVWSVAFSPDGQQIASASFDHSVKLWRAGDGALLRTLNGHREAVVHIAFSPAGDLVASGSDDSTIRIWRVRDGSLLKTLTGSDHVYSVTFSADGRWLASAGRELGALGTAWKQVTGNRLIGDRGKTIRLWRISDGSLQQALAQHIDDVWSVAFSPDGQWLASSSEDRSVKLWRLQVVSGN